MGKTGIRLGETKHSVKSAFCTSTYIGKTEIIRETEKAAQFQFAGEIVESSGKKILDRYEKEATMWLPRSQINIDGDWLSVDGWLLRKHSILKDLLANSDNDWMQEEIHKNLGL